MLTLLLRPPKRSDMALSRDLSFAILAFDVATPQLSYYRLKPWSAAAHEQTPPGLNLAKRSKPPPTRLIT